MKPTARRESQPKTGGPVGSARRAALNALFAVEKGKSERLRTALDRRNLEGKDIGLAWELALGTERTHQFLDFVLSKFVDRALPKDPLLLSVLRLGAYQLLNLSRMPPHAILNETVDLLENNRGFANAVLRKLAHSIHDSPADPLRPDREIPLPEGTGGARSLVFDEPALPTLGSPEFLAARHGMPGFLVQRWVDALGFADTEMVCIAANLSAQVVLRPTWLCSGEDLAAALAAQGVETSPTGIDDLLVVESGYPFRGPAFEKGWFIAQDPTAYQAAKAVGAQPGETILDLCAAPGTKTTVLAEAVGEGGQVLAFDTDVPRRRHILENLERLKLSDRAAVLETLEGQGPVDRVLVDVPCSNTGVLSRRVEVRRRLRPSTFEGLAEIQRSLLSQALGFCKPGGTVTYSTCSIDAAENRDVIDAVAAEHPGWEVVSDRLTIPEPLGCDGGYVATLRNT
ncbi:MAG: transcription antitermination factor NusB [Planctomycetota bacterium]|nr:transcription antitermination factor NusB [Planctomycetota bacterium]